MDMDLKVFIDSLKVEFEKEEKENVAADVVFRDLDSWNSMMALIIIAKIDNDFDVTLSADELAGSKTFKDLYKLVCLKKTKVN
ncbi:MAG: phosphopantetheine-binding protein [Chitinophagales bacterium]